jgi:hypothetical protein
MKSTLLLGALFLSIATLVPLTAPAQESKKDATFRGAGASLQAPSAKVHDYVLVVEGGSEKHSFRIDRDTTQVLDPNGKILKDSWTSISPALNQSVEVTYKLGGSEPYLAVKVQCLEQ